jgi:hypothetical protein
MSEHAETSCHFNALLLFHSRMVSNKVVNKEIEELGRALAVSTQPCFDVEEGKLDGNKRMTHRFMVRMALVTPFMASAIAFWERSV